MRLPGRVAGHRDAVDTYAVGFARPDRWSEPGTDPAHPWHAVDAHRPNEELDGEIELALCGAIVQVWGSQRWDRVGAGRTGCPACRQLVEARSRPAGAPPADDRSGERSAPAGRDTTGDRGPGGPQLPGERHLRVVS